MENTPRQKITAPNATDLQRLDKQRAVCTAYLADDQSRLRYQSRFGKLWLLRALLAANTFSAKQTYELQCMGIVLGDVFVEELGMIWVMVEDEYGRDPALQMPNTTIILYPLTMISKRIEAGQTIDVFEFFKVLATDVIKRTSP